MDTKLNLTVIETTDR